jgi:hypothetical protein
VDTVGVHLYTIDGRSVLTVLTQEFIGIDDRNVPAAAPNRLPGRIIDRRNPLRVVHHGRIPTGLNLSRFRQVQFRCPVT